MVHSGVKSAGSQTLEVEHIIFASEEKFCKRFEANWENLPN